MVRKLGRTEILGALLAFFLLGALAETAPIPAGAAAGLLGWLIAVKWSE